MNKKDAFSHKILSWYKENQRPLPWRGGTSYEVFLSEIMLQQTQVKTVIPFFQRFLQRFPNLTELAKSSLDEVYQVWQGLGYYYRARHLHQAAQIWLSLGKDPKEYKEWLSFPGVGPYTAAMLTVVLSKQPATVIDGNIKRILQRYFGLDTLKEIKTMAEKILPCKNHSEYTQGLMDLGAMVCTPKAPKCFVCPIAQHCKFKQGMWAPLVIQKSSKPTRYAHVYLCRKENELWTVQNTQTSLLKGLWGFPLSDLQSEEKMPCINLDPNLINDTVRHVFTHFTLILRAWDASSISQSVISRWSNGKWLNFEQRKLIGFSRLMRKVEEKWNF
ncbi:MULTISPECIES: A/G-specific adenine glycosylase [Holospora]|uniref:Adenine DNA glycosylase n=2 Tax=Holospora TaxID=44747 RepID=A0A061JH78_9PROT|nr:MULTISPECIES: A/G-specific adenine glycosylase [Holospora]ETZ05541.1 A/G-specific adenine glycosylase [Holospora undulata HU1]GAJ45745.1 A/G-specific adenine glycosylase [Holospora elegans E1]